MTTSTLEVHGQINTKQYRTDDLPESWDNYSDEEKLAYLRDEQPAVEQSTTNITLDEMHVYFAQNLDPDQAVDEAVTHLAVGDDNSAPTSSDSTLNNEVFRKLVTDHAQTDAELLASTFIDSNEANGETLREVGLFAGPDPTDTMWNHAIISDITKDNSRTITVDVRLTFTSA